MSDGELEIIRRKKYVEMQRKLITKEGKTATPDADKVLNGIFRGRAREVFKSASNQFPNVMVRVKELLVKLALSGELKEMSGEELYLFLVDLGLRVRLDTKIEFVSHGEPKSLRDKLKEELRKT
jgi:DNA-binding TFAR19-related protein (PDSD5 family)